jgi:hypothetical protein
MLQEVLQVAEKVPAVQMLKLDVQTPFWALSRAPLWWQQGRDQKDGLWDVSNVGAQSCPDRDDIAPVGSQTARSRI